MDIKLSKSAYPVQAVLHTCNLFSDRAYFKVDENGKEVVVSVSLKKGRNTAVLEKLIMEFQNELLHNVLRLKIAKDNKKVRELLIEQALCAALPQRREEEEPRISEEEIDKELEEILKEVEADDYKEDPLGIAIPWEDKFGKKEKKERDGKAC